MIVTDSKLHYYGLTAFLVFFVVLFAAQMFFDQILRLGVVSNVSPNERQFHPTPTPPKQNECSGTPNIPSFTASATTIYPGGSVTLSWGFVTNADFVEITPDIGEVATPGSITVSPRETKFYTLNARCGSNAASKQVTVMVSASAPPPQPSDNESQGAKEGVASSMALLLIAFPIWWFHWQRWRTLAQKELRFFFRLYLYALMVITVLIGLVSGGTAMSKIFQLILGNIPLGTPYGQLTFTKDIVGAIFGVALALVAWWYHAREAAKSETMQ